MPEIAEVTVAAVQLRHVALGRRIDEIVVTHPRSARTTGREVLDRLAGRMVCDVSRLGKWILVHLDHVGTRDGGTTEGRRGIGSGQDRGPVIGIHLRMSGQLLAADRDRPPGSDHRHAVLRLSARTSEPVEITGVPAPPVDGPGTGPGPAEVWFRDPRTFGEIRVFAGPVPVGPDLFDPTVSGSWLAERSASRRIGVKGVLLDQQRFVAGIGSYLADESLHHSGIDPRVPARDLTDSDWDRLLTAARTVAVASAASGGVTLPDEGWLDLWARPGRYQEELRVHGLNRCGTCGAATTRGVVSGRSARWCSRCQPWPT